MARSAGLAHCTVWLRRRVHDVLDAGLRRQLQLLRQHMHVRDGRYLYSRGIGQCEQSASRWQRCRGGHRQGAAAERRDLPLRFQEQLQLHMRDRMHDVVRRQIDLPGDVLVELLDDLRRH